MQQILELKSLVAEKPLLAKSRPMVLETSPIPPGLFIVLCWGEGFLISTDHISVWLRYIGLDLGIINFAPSFTILNHPTSNVFRAIWPWQRDFFQSNNSLKAKVLFNSGFFWMIVNTVVIRKEYVASCTKSLYNISYSIKGSLSAMCPQKVSWPSSSSRCTQPLFPRGYSVFDSSVYTSLPEGML